MFIHIICVICVLYFSIKICIIYKFVDEFQLHKELNETFEKCAKITETIGNFLNVIPAKAGIHYVLLWIPDISLREIPE